MAKKFRTVIRGIDKAVQQGTVRALNRATTAASTQYAKDLRQDTGLKSETIKKRLITAKARPERLRGVVAFGIKVGVPLREFQAREKQIRKGKRTYAGITVKIGKSPRMTVPGAFPLVGKTGEAVLIRKRSYTKGEYTNPNAPKYPTAQSRYRLEEPAIERAGAALTRMRESFDSNVSREIDFYLKRKFLSDK